ncbi:hypothetical protein ACFVAE_08475 [Microbacterium sp. NPDC057659]|uniref:hypothetical protein n=1 Tax=Microbacterium sp. NPDC057659 TaxID=3346198 RepID=UPI00366B96B4
MSIDGTTFVLERGQDIEDLKRRIEAAANSPARFVELVVRGGMRVSALITPQTRVTICMRAAVGTSTEPFSPQFMEWDL